jgi:hypothetical protein
MSLELFHKLAAELADLKFSGSIHPYSTNEPTINPRILHEISTLRRGCPEATIGIATNFDLFDAWFKRSPTVGLEKVLEFYRAGLTVMCVNVYDAGEEQLERYRRWLHLIVSSGYVQYTEHRWLRHNPRKAFIALTDMRIERPGAPATDGFYVRHKEGRSGTEPLKAYCSQTQRQMAVRWDGKVLICCGVDPTDEKVVVNDVNERTLVEAWNCDALMRYRWHTQQRDRSLYGCNTCRMKMAYAAIVRKVQPDEATLARWQREAP